MRVRATLGAVLVVGVALVVGAVLLTLQLRRSLVDETRHAAELRAEDVAALVPGGLDEGDLAVEDPEDAFVQVVGPDGDVVASSPNVTGQAAAADLVPEASTTIAPPVGDERFVVVAVGAGSSGTVLVGRALDDVDDSVAAVVRLLLVGIPLLLVVVGLVAWRVVGRALRPVAEMTRAVDAIGPAELDRRVPDPPGGDEIARLARTMNRMLGRVEAAQAEQRRFLSDASHELRSPVAAIRQHAEVALAHGTDGAELADAVLVEDLRLQRLVEDLLLLARGDEGVPVRDPHPVDLDDLVLAAAARVRRPGLTVDTSAVSGGQVEGDAGQLARLVDNLLDNAAHHAAGRVVVRVGEEPGAVVLQVDDDGPGVPEADRTRVFDRFVRLDEARSRDAGGAGLGLAIVATVAAAHGATVTVATSDEGGARLLVRFPA